jgi:hypothetical protein
MALASGLASSFDVALEREVLCRSEAWAKELARADGEEAIDTSHIDLAGMRKGLKLLSHADELIDQAIERAKPGVGCVLGGDFFRGPMQQLDSLDEDMKTDAARVRKELLSLHSRLCEKMTGKALS